MGRRLGQHFLFDPSILDRIVDALGPHPDDIVTEIGAGRGTLTGRLAQRVGWVVAIERDRGLAAFLRGEQGTGNGERFAPRLSNVTVIEGDALRQDWHRLVADAAHAIAEAGGREGRPVPGAAGWKVVGNIPYSITTPLIDKALEPPLPRVVVFLVQREVADRLAAAPGPKTYGALSVGVQTLVRVERLCDVPAGAFRPPPRVDSAVVRLTPLERPLVAVADQPAFRRFVTALFGRRRKQLVGVLRDVTRRDRAAIEAQLAELEIDGTARCETLPPVTIARLFSELGR